MMTSCFFFLCLIVGPAGGSSSSHDFSLTQHQHTHRKQLTECVCVLQGKSLKTSVVEFLWEAEGSAGGSRGRKGGAKGFP